MKELRHVQLEVHFDSCSEKCHIKQWFEVILISNSQNDCGKTFNNNVNIEVGIQIQLIKMEFFDIFLDEMYQIKATNK